MMEKLFDSIEEKLELLQARGDEVTRHHAAVAASQLDRVRARLAGKPAAAKKKGGK